jgi:hypothetical protein
VARFLGEDNELRKEKPTPAKFRGFDEMRGDRRAHPVGPMRIFGLPND